MIAVGNGAGLVDNSCQRVLPGYLREVFQMQYVSSIRKSVLILFLGLLCMTAQAYEGFGSATTGAGECSQPTVFHVTTLADSGTGSLRDALSAECREIRFDVAGTIFLKSRVKVPSFTTLNGASAPDVPGEYGITIKKDGGDKNITLMELDQVNDVIINDIRFIGEGNDDGRDSLSLIGCNHIVIDHISSGYADDGAIDIAWGWGWGNNTSEWANRNITVSWSILHNTAKAMLIKYGPHYNISLHHNVFARNIERSPQVRHQVETLDFVNNIVYDWGVPASWGYGLRIASHDPDQRLSPSDEELKFSGDGYIDMNIIGNLFVAGDSPRPELGIYIFKVSGGNGDMGQLYYLDNVVAPEDSIPPSTIGQPLTIPVEFQVTTYSTGDLPAQLLPSVGPKYRNPEEASILNELSGSMGPRPMPPVLNE